MNLFDELAKSAARGLSRRQALGRLGGLFGASLLGVLGFGKTARATSTASECAHWCQRFPGPQRAGCENVCKACSETGKLCGTSGRDLVCCDGTCCDGACTDLTSDLRHCGGCGRACVAGKTCCGGVCVNPQSDNANCGSCGNVCATGTVCTDGTCVDVGCPDGQTNCGGVCVNLNTDVVNCGACGVVCNVANGTGACSGGVCIIAACSQGFFDCNGSYSDGCETNVATDRNNCGACGNRCGPGATCVNGRCVCTSDANCTNNQYCNANQTCVAKLGPGSLCATNNQCMHSCVNGTCT